MKFILASQSPRRQALLKKIIPEFEIIVSNVDENIAEYDSPVDFAVKAAVKKAEAVTEIITDPDNSVIITADTIVVKGNAIFGKPKDEEDARRILGELMEIEHQVITGFCIYGGSLKKRVSGYDISNVCLKKLSDNELENYIKYSGCFDKAGAYGIQDMKSFENNNVTGNTVNFDIVKYFTGSYDNIVGFPTEKFSEKFRELYK